MKKDEYFIINSIEELNKAYYMFKVKWDRSFSLEEEIVLFNDYDCRYVLYGTFGIYLGDNIPSTHTEIQPPFRSINNLNKLI